MKRTDVSVLYVDPRGPYPVRPCEHCDSTQDVQEESGRSAHFEGVRGSADDPNRRRWLCRPCAEDWHAYWDEMWSHAQPEL